MIGVIIGAFLQFLFSRKSEFRKQQDLLKFTAYTDFIKGIAGMAISQRYKDIIKEKEYKMLVADAKSRICIYGDDSVIKRISSFFRMGGTIDSTDSEKAFVNIIVEIRKRHSDLVNININDFSQLLLGTDIFLNNKNEKL